MTTARQRQARRLRREGLTRRQIAERLGITPQAVGRLLAISGGDSGDPKGPPPRAWTAEEDALFLRMRDSDVARLLGVDATTARDRRRSLGLLPARPGKPAEHGRLTVVRDSGRRIGGHVVWHCACSCGGVAQVTTSNLRSGNTTSCGCYQQEVSRRPNEER